MGFDWGQPLRAKKPDNRDGVRLSGLVLRFVEKSL